MRRLAILLRCTAGVTAVEFAIILPALLTLICGSIEVGHLMFARMMLDGAVVDAARLSTASLETEEATRTQVMRRNIRRVMRDFPLASGKRLKIETKVYKDFSTAYPESYVDSNNNGKYDSGETYTDRNNNHLWDPATPIDGTLGGPGDVVSYTAVYPKQILFGFLAEPLGLGDGITLKSSTVVRNEAVVRKATS